MEYDMHTRFQVTIGSMGVGLLLLAFFLNLFKLLMSDSLTYILLNIIGGGLSCYASVLIKFIPFVILEGTWTVIACIGLIRLLMR